MDINNPNAPRQANPSQIAAAPNQQALNQQALNQQARPAAPQQATQMANSGVVNNSQSNQVIPASSTNPSSAVNSSNSQANYNASKIDFSAFLREMASNKSSDLFITAGFPPSMKLHGKLVPLLPRGLTGQESRDLVLNVMTPKQREEFERTHECNFAIGVAGIGRFRVSAFYQRNQVGMVLRRIETNIPTIEELKLPPVIKQLAMTKRGIIIFVGGTGTGKSTSLAAMIGYRNKNSSGHIITIEDPIEFVHQHAGCLVTQREVGIDTDSWDNALKNTLRQAPDIIMIGEVRTRETMEHAIAFAETGHLVLCTLHANNANQAIERIVNFFPEERHSQLKLDLSLNLKGVVAQQLVPNLDGKSRSAALEILLGTPLVQDYIRDGEIHKLKELMKASNEAGMQTFDQALVKLYNQGLISYENALKYADSQNEVRLTIKLNSGNAAGFNSSLADASLEKQKDY